MNTHIQGNLRRLIVAASAVLIACTDIAAQALASCQWPAESALTRPGARWWWLGSAVNKPTLTALMEEYASKGIGALEITPIYGVRNNEANELQYLSPEWMDAYKHTLSEAARIGINIDMNNGTGWPFGGRQVTVADAACKAYFQEYSIDGAGQSVSMPITINDDKQKGVATLEKLMAYSAGDTIDITPNVDTAGTLRWTAPAGQWRLIAVFCGKTMQKVKRAAPGGEGYVIDHFSRDAVSRYLDTFDTTFTASNAPFPRSLFCDSYEVYGADYTPGFFDEFAKRRGYKLENHLPLLADSTDSDSKRRIATDYRATMGELLAENFTRQWTEWAHHHGATTRCQAHGSPANLIDIYATVDVAECEGFGITNFGISGLRRDSLTLPNYSDLSMLKYASSAAHIAGHRHTSSETLTWLTEHFRTSLSQCKPETDLMFTAGVNSVFFHGTAYSPLEAPWPGWQFYATTDMSPANSLWNDAGAYFDYVSRCQSFLQYGEPDNDFLLYLPLYDIWQEQAWTDASRLVLFDIHKMQERAPRFIATVNSILSAGYDADYISDKYVLTLRYDGNKIITEGGAAYHALIIPGARLMPLEVISHIHALARQGARIVIIGDSPADMPGYNITDGMRQTFRATVDSLESITGNVIRGTDYADALAATGVKAERMRAGYGLSAIRRRNGDGNHYFIAALKPGDTTAWIPLAVPARSAVLYNPLTGESGKARVRQANGTAEVLIQLASGESTILRTFADTDVSCPEWHYWTPQGDTLALPDTWEISFTSAEPEVKNMPEKAHLGSWTDIDGADGVDRTMATACYKATFNVKKSDLAGGEWMLDLGDVRESARVRINGTDIATLFCVPYRCLIGKYLKKGENTIELSVTNLPANRIADMDRKGVEWRIFKDINIVDINYKRETYARWKPVPSGFLGPVRIVRMAETDCQ